MIKEKFKQQNDLKDKNMKIQNEEIVEQMENNLEMKRNMRAKLLDKGAKLEP